jgi:hypothetical protein
LLEAHLYQFLTPFFLGSGVTTTFISLIANAGQADQAIATAGNFFFHYCFFDVHSYLTEIMQYHTFSALSEVSLDYQSKHTYPRYPAVYASKKAVWC